MRKTVFYKILSLGVAAFIFSQEAWSVFYEVMLTQEEKSFQHLGIDCIFSRKGESSFIVDIPPTNSLEPVILSDRTKRFIRRNINVDDINDFLNNFLNNNYVFNVRETLLDEWTEGVPLIRQIMYPIIYAQQGRDLTQEARDPLSAVITDVKWSMEEEEKAMVEMYNQIHDNIWDAVYGAVGTEKGEWEKRYEDHGLTVKIQKLNNQ